MTLSCLRRHEDPRRPNDTTHPDTPVNPFQNASAIVTGGASGIGRALCEELARRGARVIVADVNAAGAREVAEAITSRGTPALPAAVDVRSADEVAALV